jgi:hypothetical protein
MQPLMVLINDLEEWQMIHDDHLIQKTFLRGKETILHGEWVKVGRKDKSGEIHLFDKFDSIEEWEQFFSRFNR